MRVTGHTKLATAARRRQPPGGARPRSASIRDVAAAAGVSYQTVSRVINGSTKVDPSTRQEVLRAIEELDFRPNRAARALAGGPLQSVTVLTSNTTLYGYAAMLQGIEDAARAANFGVGIRVLESDADVEDAVARSVDPGTALIVIAFDRLGRRALHAIPPEVPYAAAVETPDEGTSAGQPWVWIDDHGAAAEATRYLIDLGHRTVHYVPIPASTETSPRLLGWRSALRSAAAPVRRPVRSGWDAAAGYDAGRRLAADPAVTAVLCGNDDLALGVMRAMREAGRAIPREVSIVGFDDTPSSAYLTPALTTVRLDFIGLGRACFALLSGGPTAAPGPQLPPQLVIRESAAKPRRGR